MSLSSDYKLNYSFLFQSLHHIVCKISSVNFNRLIVIESEIHIVQRTIIVWNNYPLACTPIILILRIVEVLTPCFHFCSRLMNTFYIHIIMLISMSPFMNDCINN